MLPLFISLDRYSTCGSVCTTSTFCERLRKWPTSVSGGSTYATTALRYMCPFDVVLSVCLLTEVLVVKVPPWCFAPGKTENCILRAPYRKWTVYSGLFSRRLCFANSQLFISRKDILNRASSTLIIFQFSKIGCALAKFVKYKCLENNPLYGNSVIAILWAYVYVYNYIPVVLWWSVPTTPLRGGIAGFCWGFDSASNPDRGAG